MDILSGKTRVSRVQLKELAGGTEEDVSAVVEQIVDGAFKNRRSGLSVGGDDADDASDIEDMRPWERQFAAMTDDFRLTLRGYAKADDTVAVKSALRQYIEMLEDLYRGI